MSLLTTYYNCVLIDYRPGLPDVAYVGKGVWEERDGGIWARVPLDQAIYSAGVVRRMIMHKVQIQSSRNRLRLFCIIVTHAIGRIAWDSIQ